MPLFRIDDIGASTKHFNQHGRKHIRLFGKIPFYFPFANIWFFKRIEPFRGWAVYDELTVPEWEKILAVFKEYGIVPIIAVTATWVERDSTLVPFPEKFPEQAKFLKEAFHRGEIVIANHGLTHCVVGKHLPRFWSSNRKYQREFLPELDSAIHLEHIHKSQEILETFFEKPVTRFVPPGNIWCYKTYLALKGTSIKVVTSKEYMQDYINLMDGIEFIQDGIGRVPFHDRELKLYGVPWLRALIEKHISPIIPTE